MIQKLEADEYQRVSPIFGELDYNLEIKAIVEGTMSGRIYVDDAEKPSTAFIWNNYSKFFLAGYENNNMFNTSLNKLIVEEIYPEATEKKIWGYVLHYHPDSWKNVVGVVLRHKLPMKDYRRYYTPNQLKIDWRNEIPKESSILRVDRNLLDRVDLKNISKVTDEINKTWGSTDNFLRNGFGFCFLHGETIACWCLSENNSGNRCEIGIETDEEYRQKGFATLTASAFLEYCISKGIDPGWHCWDSNLPSVRLAEKIGFEKLLEYPVFFDWFDEFNSLLVNGNWRLLRRTEFREAGQFYEKAFEIKEAGSSFYYNAARAWALAGEKTLAFKNLRKAVDKDWNNLERMKNDADLQSLHGEKEWIEFMIRLEGEQAR